MLTYKSPIGAPDRRTPDEADRRRQRKLGSPPPRTQGTTSVWFHIKRIRSASTTLIMPKNAFTADPGEKACPSKLGRGTGLGVLAFNNTGKGLV